MKRIYTRTGDKGMTGIHGGERVFKDDIRIEANGCIDDPGGTPVSAQLQFARTVARRAERRLWTLHKQDPLPEIILRFINRLSDLFFVMARYEMQQQNWTEEKWQSFAYKRKKKE